jgi:hypothetical protein
VNPGVAVATTQGGSATFNADGTFTYTSAPGFEGTDTFTYTLRDTGIDGIAGNGDDLTSTGTVSITVAPAPTIWFIDNSVSGGPGDGTQDNPFRSIAEFNAANDGGAGHPGDGDVVYLRFGTGTYTEADGINLANGQTLIGQGQDLVVGGITIEDGDSSLTPTIQIVNGDTDDGIDLAQNNTISGLNVDNLGSGIGIDDNGNVGTLNISDISVSTTSGTGIELISGGTVTVTGAGNTITSGTGTALNITNTTIGAADVTFESISANGASTNAGIILNTTGTNGGLVVTGLDGPDGDSFADAGSGGTIANRGGSNAWSVIAGVPTLNGTTGGVGVYMNNTHFTSLSGMQLNDFSNTAIMAFASSNLTLNDTVISGANGNDTANDESALSFYNLTGTSAINRGTYSGGFEDNLHVLNENDMAGGLTVSNATFGFNSTANGNNSISVEARGADAYIAFTLQDSFIRGARSDFINALPSSFG